MSFTARLSDRELDCTRRNVVNIHESHLGPLWARSDVGRFKWFRQQRFALPPLEEV